LNSRFVAVAACCFVAAAQAQTAPTPKLDKEALERAEKQADGPRRRILEAAKMKPAAAPLVATAPAPPVAAAEPVLHTLGKGAALLDVPAAAVATVPTVAPVELVPVSTALVALPAAPDVVLAAPRLLDKVEPELPSRLLRRGAPRTEVQLELTVNADGSVSDVHVRSSTNAEIQDAVVDAVRRWRYDVHPVARRHSVRLVVMPSS
jgi:TonB family protein